MPIYGLPATRMCWKTNTRVTLMKRRELIESAVRFRDDTLDPGRDDSYRDPRFKLRRFLNVEPMRSVPMDEPRSAKSIRRKEKFDWSGTSPASPITGGTR